MAKKQNHIKNAIATTTLTLGAGYGAYWLAQQGVFDTNFPVPNVEYIDGAPDTLKSTLDGIREASPIFLGAIMATYTAFLLKATKDPILCARRDLAESNYSTKEGINSQSGKKRRIRHSLGKLASIATIVTLGISMSSAMEREISDGPSRPIETVIDLLADNSSKEDTIFVTSDKRAMFMGNSYVSWPIVSLINEQLGFVSDKMAVPFDITFVSLQPEQESVEISGSQLLSPNRWGMTISYPLDGNMDISATDCDSVKVVADDATGAKEGKGIIINGRRFVVDDVDSGLSSMNRATTVMDLASAEKCLQDTSANEDVKVWGVALSGVDENEIEDIINNIKNNHPEQQLYVLTKDELLENNKDFWSKNGTPLIIILIITIASLGALNISAKRKAILAENSSLIANLRVNGVPFSEIRNAELIRSVSESLRAMPLAILGTYATTIVINMTEVGINVQPNLQDFALATSIVMASSAGASLLTTDEFNRKLDIAEALRE